MPYWHSLNVNSINEKLNTHEPKKNTDFYWGKYCLNKQFKHTICSKVLNYFTGFIMLKNSYHWRKIRQFQIELSFLQNNINFRSSTGIVIHEGILFFLSRKLNKLQSGKEDGKVSKDKKKKKKKHRKKSRSSEEGRYIIKFS